MLNENTKWVLFLATSTEPEERHIYDLAFGLLCLESVGLGPAEIEIYIDGTRRAFIEQLMQNATNNTYNIKTSSDFFADLTTNTNHNLVIFVTGHGDIDGIDANPSITPFRLLTALKTSPELQNAVVYLGQCQAGIFNFLPAGKMSPNEPDIVLMGATNLHNSLSNPTIELFNGNHIPWIANLFLLHLFKWISAPIDVDGDGKFTVIDSYKYAGVMANNVNKDMKATCFLNAITLHERLEQAKMVRNAIANTPNHNPNDLLQRNAIVNSLQQQYMQVLEVQHTHQECWILNAIPAQRLEF